MTLKIKTCNLLRGCLQLSRILSLHKSEFRLTPNANHCSRLFFSSLSNYYFFLIAFSIINSSQLFISSPTTAPCSASLLQTLLSVIPLIIHHCYVLFLSSPPSVLYNFFLSITSAIDPSSLSVHCSPLLLTLAFFGYHGSRHLIFSSPYTFSLRLLTVTLVTIFNFGSYLIFILLALLYSIV